MSNANMLYTAMMEGRWRPTLEVDQLENGSYRAHYMDGNGKTIEFTDDSQSHALNTLSSLVRDAARNGEIAPR